MTHPYVAEALVRDREREARATARRARLAALIACCRPSRLVAGMRRLRDTLVTPRAEARC